MKFLMRSSAGSMSSFRAKHVDHALDHVGRFRHPERAAIGDTARRLVGVDAVDADIGPECRRTRCRSLKKPAGNLVGSAQASNAPWSASTWHAETGDLAVLGRRQLAPGHVVIAGKGRGGQVLDPVLDPLDRHARSRSRRRWRRCSRDRPRPCCRIRRRCRAR